MRGTMEKDGLMNRHNDDALYTIDFINSTITITCNDISSVYTSFPIGLDFLSKS